VDVFRVRPQDDQAPDAAALQAELTTLLDLMAEGRGAEARERIHLRLAEAIEEEAVPRGVAGDITIDFRDDTLDARFTVMEVRGPDARGFLYTLANALAMRGLHVHEVRIESVAGEARDRFRIAWADKWRPLQPAEQDSLRQAVALIRHFTSLLPAAPDSGRALRYFDQLLDRTAEHPRAFEPFSTGLGLHDLARFLGSSAFLWEDLVRDHLETALPVLAGFRNRPLRARSELRSALRARLRAIPPEERAPALRTFRDEETLLIETKRLLDPFVSLERFAWALSDLGEALLAEALEEAGSAGLAALALGKFGGREMGHASDLELLFVYDEPGPEAAEESGRRAEEAVRAVLQLLAAPEGALFHVDLRLRPYGRKGALATPLWALRGYYRPGGEAAPFERQALLKLRFVAGDEDLGRRVERLRDGFVWREEAWDREASVRLRERQARELVPPGRFNVKLSRGGLVDAEYTVQYLQIQHGGACPLLRTPATLPALDRLQTTGILDAAEHEALRAGYLFWREVADALRVVQGHAADLLLPEEGSDDYGFLARRLGRSGGRGTAGRTLAREVAHHQERLRTLFDARFGRG
jgi:glutamate-ammonia-ligase adenylyltransferase